MLLIEQFCSTTQPADEQLVLPFERRQKSRLRTRLGSGEEVGLFLARGTILRGGDRLQGNDGRVVLVVAASEPSLLVTAASERDLVRAAYHLGNRHVPLQVGDGWLRLGADYVLQDMLDGLGVQVREETAPFEPEAGAYGGHVHRHGDEEGHAGIIHEFS